MTTKKVDFCSYVVLNSNGAPMCLVEISDDPEYQIKHRAIDRFLNSRVFYFFKRNKWWNYYQWAGYKVVKVKIKLEES